MNTPSAAHSVTTPSQIIPISGDLGAFTNNITATNQGRDNGGPFYDNVSAGDLGGPTNCNVGHFVLGIMDQCHYAIGSSNSNSPAVGAVFSTGSYWGLQGNAVQPAGFMFNGSQSYTVTVVGGFRGGDSEVGWFTIDGFGVYHFNPVPTWSAGPDVTLTPIVVNPGGANWGFYYSNGFNGHTGAGCGGAPNHWCSDATAGIPADPVTGTPNQNQFALFTNSTGTQFAVGIEDNQLQLISDGNGLLHDSDYQDYIFTIVPIANPTLDLTIGKTGPSTATTNQQITYSIIGTNSGPATALNVKVQDTLPAGATYVSSNNGGTQSGGVVTWPTIASLASGASTPTYTVTVSYAAAGSYLNNTHIFTTSTETNANNNHAQAPTVVSPPVIVANQGCSPGYWKNHTGAGKWPSPYSPTQQFSAVFENAFPGQTLQQVLANGGGGLNALGRQVVSALLNAQKLGASNYGMTAAQVISAFNGVFPGSASAYTTLQNQLEAMTDVNGRVCPLN